MLEDRLQNRKNKYLCYICSSPTNICHYYDLAILKKEGESLVFLFLQVHVLLPVEGADNSEVVGSRAAITEAHKTKQNIKQIR